MQSPATERPALDSNASGPMTGVAARSAPVSPEPASPAASLRDRYVAWSLDAACLLPLLLMLASTRLHHAMANATSAITAVKDALPRLMEGMLASPQPTMQMAQAWLADPVLAGGVQRLEAAVGDMLLTPLLLYALLAMIWSVAFESSRWQATPGKRALGLVVASADGKKLKTGHALQRFLASSLSWLTLNIGHAMAALPPRRLALHDRLSDTRVLRERGNASLPAWAWAWLLLQGAAALGALLWLFIQLQTAMSAAMQQAMGGL